MSLFGEKCDRCGSRTKNTRAGQPICETCVEEMDLLVKAEAESRRSCPIDGQAMSKEIAHMLVIDRCPKCNGIWLDGGELERIKGGVEAAALKAMAHGFTGPFG